MINKMKYFNKKKKIERGWKSKLINFMNCKLNYALCLKELNKEK